VYVLGTQPRNGKLVVAWAVAGLNPSLGELVAGVLPEGAVVGKNTEGKTGYSLCPAKGANESYVIAVYALREKLPVSAGFDPIAERKQALKVANSTGLLVATYAKR
jgi:hypothetical protein